MNKANLTQYLLTNPKIASLLQSQKYFFSVEPHAKLLPFLLFMLEDVLTVSRLLLL